MEFQQIGGGPPLILLPGLGCDARLWEASAGRLADRFTLVTPAIWEHDSLADAADAVAEVIAGLGQGPAGVAGLSMGGYVAFELLARWPQRVRAAAILDSTPYGDSPERVEKRLQVLRLLRDGGFEAVLRAFAGSVLTPENAAGGEARRLLLAMAHSLGPETYARSSRAILERGAYERVLRDVRVPVLFVTGELDTLTPPEVAKRAAAEIPGARAEVVPGAAHMTPLEAPEAVARLLGEFFGSALPPGPC